MTIAAAVHTALEHADALVVATSKVLSSRAGEVDAVFIFGLIAVAVGLASLIYGLRADWRRTRVHYRHRHN
jgi:hypothetical protein